MERIDLSDAFLSKLEKIFPGALLMEEQLVRATRVLSNHGFKESNSIALVCQCRDELTLPFEDAIKLLWGSNFNISSLAGMMFCGKTGLQAGMAHAPRDSKTGMERYVFFVGPHIAIDTDGNVGKVSPR